MAASINQLLEESFEFYMSNVHTCTPAVVKRYNKDKRRAEVQPSLKRKMANGEFMELPIVVDVPVVYLGSKKCGLHFDLEEGDEVLLLFSERCLDEWKNKGGAGIEDKDIRRFSMCDCVAIPGLQAKEFPNTNDGLSIHEDEKITITTKDTTIIIDGKNVSVKDGNQNEFILDNNGIVAKTSAGSKIELSSSGAVIQGILGKVEIS